MNDRHGISSRQGGAALIVSLMILALMTILGASAMNTNLMEERMAGNMLNKEVAFQSAETALRKAEEWLGGLSELPRERNGRGPIWKLRSPDPDGDGDPWWSEADWSASRWSRDAVVLGGGDAVAGVASQPAYVIEKLPVYGTTNEAGQNLNGSSVYLLITARGVGKTEDAVVILQSVYKWQ